jgi:hypothetical protein
MASNYNSLGFNLMTTGENAGSWGNNTNDNLNFVKNMFGYITLDMAAADKTLTIPDNSVGTNDGRAMIVEMTGTLAGTRVLDIAATAGSGTSPGGTAAILKPFIVFDNTTHDGNTLTFKVTGATGFALTEGTTYLCYHNGTDIINTNLGATTPPGGSTTEVQFNNSAAFDGDANLVWVAADGLTIASEKEIRLGDNTGGEYVGIKAPTAISPSAYTLTMPAATGAVDEVLSTNGSGVLSWVAMAGGTSWAAVVTGATKTAVAGEGYFIDTTLNACNLTLPGGTLGDEVSVVDYAGTFDTNNLTVTPDTGEKIQGNTADATLTVATERAGFTLAYSGSAQGWLLKNN